MGVRMKIQIDVRLRVKWSDGDEWGAASWLPSLPEWAENFWFWVALGYLVFSLWQPLG